MPNKFAMSETVEVNGHTNNNNNMELSTSMNNHQGKSIECLSNGNGHSPSSSPSQNHMPIPSQNMQGQRGHSPNRHRYTPSPHSQANSPNLNHLGQNQQHVVHLHVNPGEAISFHLGSEMQLIQGPATVRMVSNSTNPPVPMPMQVPPGHLVQQIVDENGTLRHVILSPQPALVPPISGPPTYAGPAGGPFYHYPPPHTHAHSSPHYHPHPHPQYPHPHGPPPHMQPGIPPQGIHVPPHHHSHQGPSPPPAHAHIHKDERAQRQFNKLRKKLEAKQREGYYHSNIPPSPQKDIDSSKYKDRNTSTSGLDDLEDNHIQEDEEEVRILTELLSKVRPIEVYDITARSALLKWSSPDMFSENGENNYSEFDIQESEFIYEIFISDKGKEGTYKQVFSGDSKEYTLRDLKPASEYHVYLNSLLDELKGSPSQSFHPGTQGILDSLLPDRTYNGEKKHVFDTRAVDFKTLSCEPDRPLPPKLSARTKTSIILKWNATGDNGSKITHYTLEYDESKPDGPFVEIFTGLQKQFKVIKLQASTCYRFRLSATNDIGKSDYSEVLSCSTSGSVPSQPDSPQMKEAFVHELHLIWQRRSNDDDFTLQMEDESTGHGFLPVYNGRDLTYICNNLRRNAEYKFRLSANNEEGSSKWSDIVSYRTHPDRPGVPSKPVLKGRIHSTNFRVTWDPPKDNGGSEITNFVLELDYSNGFEIVYTGPDNDFNCDHLQPGHMYHVRVFCISAGGHSEYSDVCSITTLPVPPGICPAPHLHGKPKATTLHLKWLSPEKDGGAPVTEFEIDMTMPDNTTRQVYKGRDTDCSVVGLLPGRPYLFQVRAYNRAGCGPWSEPLEVVSGAGPPDRPKEPRVQSRSPQSAIISWEEPVNNGATITEFRVEWRQKEGDDFTQLYLGPALSYEIRGLTPATAYSYRIQAINSAGAGPFSAVATFSMPPSSPATVLASSIKDISTATSISLSWKEPNNHGSEITAYNIDCGDKHFNIGNVLEYHIDQLLPETLYRIRIQAVNSVGVGPYSSIIKVSTRSLPPAPPKLECPHIGYNCLKLKWGDGKNSDFIRYTLEMETRTGSFTPVYQGTGFVYKPTKLNELTAYRFRVFATNDAGNGPFSEVYTYTTTKAPPPSLKPPKITKVTENSCTVEWQRAKPVGDEKLIYQLLLLKDQETVQIYKGPETCYFLTSLDSKTEHKVRVGCIRQGQDGTEEMIGALSQCTSFITLCKEPIKTINSKVSLPQIVERKPLTDQQWAMIILFGFTIFAIFIAILTQQIIAYTKKSS